MTSERHGGRSNTHTNESANTMDPVRDYLVSIGKFPLLTAEDEVELSKQIEAGIYAGKLLAASNDTDHQYRDNWDQLDDEYKELKSLSIAFREGENAKIRMIESNLRLVVSIAKRYTGRNMPLLDLIQEGNLGLIRAVEKFDYTMGYKFSTYSTPWIQVYVERGIMEKSRIVDLPVHVGVKINKIIAARGAYLEENGTDPTIDELAKIVKIEPEKVEKLIIYSKDATSLDVGAGEEEDASLGEILTDESDPTVSQLVEHSLLRGELEKALGTLGLRAGYFMREYYGLDSGIPKSHREIAESVGMTTSAVSLVIRKSLKKIRENPEFSELKGFAS